MTAAAPPAAAAPAPGASPAVTEERFLALDALRGIGAIAVLLVHISFLGGYRQLAPVGYLAVDLFFVISGFVIGWAFEPRLLAGMSRRRFMALRLIRLYPVLFLGLLLGIAANLVAPAGDYRIGWTSLGHFLLIPDFRGPGLFPLNGVFWTLFFELAIYAAHALVAQQLTTPRLAAFVCLSGIAWAAIAILLGDWGAGWTGSTFAGGAVRVGWGYGAGLLVYRLARSGQWRAPRLPFLLPLGAALILLLAPRVGWPVLRNAASVFLFFPLLVLLSVTAEVPRRARPLARWLADISYPLYAIHLPLLLIAGHLIGGSGRPASWAAAGALCLLLASTAAYGYERPLRVFLRSRLGSGGVARAAAASETVYSAVSPLRTPRTFLVDALRDSTRSVDIAWRLFRSELRARRRQSLLGHLWLFLPAAATAIVCAYLQRRGIVGLQPTALPYPLFVLGGVLLWQTFTDALNAPLQQLNAMRQLITRSRVPHEAVVAAGAAGSLLNASIRLAALLLVLPLFGMALAPSLLLLPLGFFSLFLLGLAAGMILAPFGLLYEDVGRGLPFATLFWFFLSPVVYPVAAGETWLRFNPVAPLIDASRSWLVAPSMPAAFAVVFAASVLMLVLGLLFYRLARPHLVARLG